MSKNLNDRADRENILNNTLVVAKLQEEIGIEGMLIEGEFKYTINQVAEFYDIDEKTVDRYLKDKSDELKLNGYEVFTGKRLAEAKIKTAGGINVPTKTTRLGLFNFRALLNLGMFVNEGEKAQLVRSRILDITLQTLHDRVQDKKYINQADENYIIERYTGKKGRKILTDALKDYVGGGQLKYPKFTNYLYVTLFGEEAKKYRKLLDLRRDELTRDTMYKEVLLAISTLEVGFAEAIENTFNQKGRIFLSWAGTDEVYNAFISQRVLMPIMETARRVMFNRDKWFRDVEFEKLIAYNAPLDVEDFEIFLRSNELRRVRNIRQDDLEGLQTGNKLKLDTATSQLTEPEFENLLKASKS